MSCQLAVKLSLQVIHRTLSIYVGINRKAGVAEFFPFKKSGQKQLVNDAVSLDLRMGEYLFSMLADSESNIRDYLDWDNE